MVLEVKINIQGEHKHLMLEHRELLLMGNSAVTVTHGKDNTA